MKKMTIALGVALAFAGCALHAKTVNVTLTAKEVDLPIDNKGTMYRTWTFSGQVPGPVVRVTEGDVVEFTLINDKNNKNSHSVDFHAARVDVMKEFEPVKPGETKKFTFPATYPGTFFYHCGADPMIPGSLFRDDHCHVRFSTRRRRDAAPALCFQNGCEGSRYPPLSSQFTFGDVSRVVSVSKTAPSSYCFGPRGRYT